MRYRRLGRTELMVSEVGLDADALRGVQHDEAVAVLRGALAAGLTLVTWSVGDGLEDLEPVIAEAARAERGRLTLVARLDQLPAPNAIGPQAEAIGARLGSPVDILAFPEPLTDEEDDAIASLRTRALARFVAYAGEVPLQPAQAGKVDVVVAEEPIVPPAGLGFILLAPVRHPGADCTAIPVRSMADLAEVLRGAGVR